MTPGEYRTHRERETEDWGRAFAAGLRAGDKVALEGELGAGKTLLCRGICRGLGYEGNVQSPSYGLVNEYLHQPPIFHIDLYRLEPDADWQEIGLDHYMAGTGICLIEWPDRACDAGLIFDHLLRLEYLGPDDRLIRYQRRNQGI